MFYLCSSRLLALKTEAQRCKPKSSPKSYKTEIKILANPGLAYSDIEQPGPGKQLLTGMVTFSAGDPELLQKDKIQNQAYMGD